MRYTNNFSINFVTTVNVFIFLLTFSLMLRDPFPRGIELSQAIGMLGVVLLLIIKRKNSITRETMLFMLVLFSFLGWSLFVTVVGSVNGTNDLYIGLQDFRDFGSFALISIGLIVLGIKYDWKPLFWAIILGMSLEIVLRQWPNLYMLLFNLPLGLRYVGGFTSPNTYGAATSMIFSGTLWLLLTGRVGKFPIIYLLAFCLATITLVSTLSRGGVIGAIGSITILLAFNLFKKILRSENYRNFYVGSLLIFLGLLFLYSNPLNIREMQRILDKIPSFSLLQRRFTSNTDIILEDRARTELAQAAWEIMNDNPILGVGLGGFSRLNASYGGTGTTSPHNELLKVGAETGLIGVVLVFFILAYPILMLYYRQEIVFYTPIPAMFLSFLIAELFFSHLARPHLSLIYAILLGYIFNQPLPQRINNHEKTSNLSLFRTYA